jgi:hypothetical protein
MRITRSQKQWKIIIDNQQTSGLTIIDYYATSNSSYQHRAFMRLKKNLV